MPEPSPAPTQKFQNTDLPIVGRHNSFTNNYLVLSLLFDRVNVGIDEGESNRTNVGISKGKSEGADIGIDEGESDGANLEINEGKAKLSELQWD